MTLKLFSELFDTFGKVVNTLKSAVNMPRAERDKYRATLSETFTLMDTTINMITIRLGELMREHDDAAFIREAGGLDNASDWVKAERAFRMCEGLRVAVREAESLPTAALGTVSANDWHGLIGRMQEIAGAEWNIADYISTQLAALSAAARAVPPGGTAQVRSDIEAVRQALLAERRKLLKLELDLHAIV